MIGVETIGEGTSGRGRKEQMRLKVNGEDRDFPPGEAPENLAALIHSLGIDQDLVVAEVNGDIVRRDAGISRTLADGDCIEIVRLVGGG
jgi:sulfur carrier protein